MSQYTGTHYYGWAIKNETALLLECENRDQEGEPDLGGPERFSDQTLVLPVNADDRCEAEPWGAWFGRKGYQFLELVAPGGFKIECERENF